eukprot:13211394-Alexandrium_andersonii.AAC.1
MGSTLGRRNGCPRRSHGWVGGHAGHRPPRRQGRWLSHGGQPTAGWAGHNNAPQPQCRLTA